MKELSVLAVLIQVIAYYPKLLFLCAPYHFAFESVWSAYGRVTAYWGVWNVCYELIGTLQGEIICPSAAEASSIDKPAYIISAQLFSIVGCVLSAAAILLTIIYIGDVLRKKRLGQITAYVGAGLQLGQGVVLVVSVPPMLAGAANDALIEEELVVRWSFFMGYADAGLVLLSGAAALIAAIVGDKWGIMKVKPETAGKKKWNKLAAANKAAGLAGGRKGKYAQGGGGAGGLGAAALAMSKKDGAGGGGGAAGGMGSLASAVKATADSKKITSADI
ncbi:uncharacterized protein LOC142335905 [Convolutriloba macropyga]|uniref:uncharacterized protein LOC142335905 n=1 Tax=Convolutriloba macropyga TaxID=536237 RepID=UPI003F528692